MSDHSDGATKRPGGPGNGNGATEAAAGAVATLTRKDFESDQEVRWCPGCGDYSILAQFQKTLPALNIPREKMVIVSGIGCSSRFPYYVNTYGFHSIHGRAPTLATGIKVANPDLTVWVVTGDGDALSIGGNHFLHALRRNIDIKMLLFNNKIYGLTKGQYSPTSELGKRTKSSPMGSPDYPVHPVCVALAAEATFTARTVDTDTRHLVYVLERAARHKGSAFVEIYQNCNIFNDGAWDMLKDKPVRHDRMVELRHGEPLIFGAKRDRGIRMNGTVPEVVTIGENGITEKDLLVHNENEPLGGTAYALARMEYPDFPVAIGVFTDVERPTYEQMVDAQIRDARAKKGDRTIDQLIAAGECWEVK